MVPTSLGLILPEFEPSQRHAAIGVWAATSAIAAAAGPPLGGLLVQLDWRWVFLVNVPVGLVALLAARRVLSEHRERDPLAPDIAGAVAFVVAVGSLVLAIVEGQDWGWASGGVIGLVVLALALLAGIWWRSNRHASPLIDPQMFRVRTFSLAVGASVLFFAGFAAMLLNGVLFLTTIWHEGVLTTGLMLFPGPFTAAAFSVPSARLGARLGYRLPGIAGATLFLVASLWWITQTHGAPAYVSEYLPAMVMTGAGVGLVLPTLTGAGASSLPPERFATGAAVLTMGRQVGSALGIALLVAVLGASTATLADFHAAWLISVLGAVSTGVAFAALRPARAAATPVVPPAAAS